MVFTQTRRHGNKRVAKEDIQPTWSPALHLTETPEEGTDADRSQAAAKKTEAFREFLLRGESQVFASLTNMQINTYLLSSDIS